MVFTYYFFYYLGIGIGQLLGIAVVGLVVLIIYQTIHNNFSKEVTVTICPHCGRKLTSDQFSKEYGDYCSNVDCDNIKKSINLPNCDWRSHGFLKLEKWD